MFGSKNSQIATLVERQSRYVMLAKVGKKDTETVVNALIKHAHKLPHELYQSLTWDCGKEMADHQRFTLATDIKVYFCDPRSPWQRGSNENANGLLRQYLPKGIDLSGYSQSKLTRLPGASTNGPERHWTTKHQLNDFIKLLRPPVESAVESSHHLARSQRRSTENDGTTYWSRCIRSES